tara:strand:+ start:271 stop:960 length:690 start_codon:yes stop_codon:yes gene_type:complete
MAQEISEWGRSLTHLYPSPEQMPRYSDDIKRDIFRFTKLWLTEGIPHAFQSNPIVFEYAREALAKELSENTKNISLTGSARIGFSMAPNRFGAAFNPNESDLDLFLISESWLEKLSADFFTWLARYRSGFAKSKNEREEYFWKSNADQLPAHINNKGFVDAWRIPNYERYEYVQQVNRAAELFRTQLNNHLPANTVFKKVTLRVYKNWDRAVSQIGGSLISSIKKRPIL